MQSELDRQLESIALQLQYRNARNPARVWSADMNPAQAVVYWYTHPAEVPEERRVELLELCDLAERLIDNDFSRLVDAVMADTLNRDLLIVGRDVQDVDPQSAGIANDVARSLFRARHELQLETMAPLWSDYVASVLSNPA